jgi:hypothetical protein
LILILISKWFKIYEGIELKYQFIRNLPVIHCQSRHQIQVNFFNKIIALFSIFQPSWDLGRIGIGKTFINPDYSAHCLSNFAESLKRSNLPNFLVEQSWFFLLLARKCSTKSKKIP